jgi:hypothetical protein
LIPIKSSVSNNVIILSITFLAMLLIYSVINYLKNKQLSDIIVFVNLIMLFCYSHYSETIHNHYKLISFIYPTHVLSFIVIISLVFFLLFRERIVRQKVPFLTGIDLIIIIFILVLNVSSSMLPDVQIGNINAILFHSFLIYMFYKVVVAIKIKSQIPLYYLSFILPISILVYLLFNH